MDTEEVELSWTGVYNVAHPSQKLPGDKIILPPSALEQLLSAATVRVPVERQRDYNFDSFNPYSLAAARAEQSRWQDTKQQLPHPLTFRLVNSSNGNVVHAGIREFSAQEGEIGLSPFLLEALGLDAPKPRTKKSRGLKSVEGDGVIDVDAPIDLTGVVEKDTEVEIPPKITVHAKQLSKGTYVRLRPLEAGYNPADWKSLLERHMRDNYTTLTKGEILTVDGGRAEQFRFLIDKFVPEGDGICVVDTDLEVDIEALNEEQARETLKKIMAKEQQAPGTAEGSTVGHELDIWNTFSGQVRTGEYVDYTISSWDRTQALQMDLNTDRGAELEMFVSPYSKRQRVRPREDEHTFGIFDNKDNKKLIIQPSNVELEGAEAFFVTIYGVSKSESTSTTVYDIRVSSLPQAGAATSSGIDSGEDDIDMHSSEEEQCKNCQQWIPKRTMMLHENFCLRNNVSCPQCKKVFQKRSPEFAAHWHCPLDSFNGDSPESRARHDEVYHAPRSCGRCPYDATNMIDLASHRVSTCPEKLILCQFCHLEVAQEGDPLNPSAEQLISGLTAHELADGGRTTNCHLCNSIVRLRDMSTHLKHHDLEKTSKSAPAICRNVLCARTLEGVGKNGEIGAGRRMGQGSGNELGVCSICYGPLYANVHDPDLSRLKRRIERVYIRQLIAGCGKKHCENIYCKIGKANLADAKPIPMTAQEAMVVSKPLVDTALVKNEVMWLCTEEVIQKRRKIAEMMAAEGDYALEFCVAALEAESGRLDGARTWLANWAPKTSA